MVDKGIGITAQYGGVESGGDHLRVVVWRSVDKGDECSKGEEKAAEGLHGDSWLEVGAACAARYCLSWG